MYTALPGSSSTTSACMLHTDTVARITACSTCCSMLHVTLQVLTQELLSDVTTLDLQVVNKQQGRPCLLVVQS